MNWIKLYKMQKELDKHINENHPPKDGENRLIKKTLATVVEMAETLEDTKSFKFWSNKPKAKDSAILEEAVDVLHFINSEAIDRGVDPSTIKPHKIETEDINEVARDLIHNIVLNSYKGFNQYNVIYSHYMRYIELLGFMDVDVMVAYEKKNKKNHARQEVGY